MLKMTFLSPLQISIHALREEGDSPAFCGEGSALVFLSTPSARRATSEIAKSNISVLFLSTPSARRATPASRCTFHPTAHFYPRPPRGGRPFWAETVEYTTPFLSTPSARRATHFKRTSARHNAISIHALREEGDQHPGSGRPSLKQFLSTPSARRATAKTETKSLFSYKLYNILHEFRRALIYNGSKSYPNHAK